MADTVMGSGALASKPSSLTFVTCSFYFTASSLNSLPTCESGMSTNTEAVGTQELGETLPSLTSRSLLQMSWGH